MYNSVANSLFHKKECLLPGIGILYIENISAETDFVNTQIKSPSQKIMFKPLEGSPDLQNEYAAFSDSILNQLGENKKVELSGIGTFYRNDREEIQFEPLLLDDLFFPPVTAYRVIREHAEHNMLVGDKETTSSVMTEFFTEEPVIKDRWWIWAAAIAVISLSVIIFNFYNNGFTLGNKTPVQLTPPDIFHKVIK